MNTYYYQTPEHRPFWIANANASQRNTGVIPEHPTIQRNLIQMLQDPKIRQEAIIEYVANHPPRMTQADMKVLFEQKAAIQGPVYLAGPPWKGTLAPTGCAEWVTAQCDAKRKEAAQVYCENITYIPHDTFVKELYALYETLPKEDTYFLVSEGKSSEYCALLLQQRDPTLSSRILYIDLWRNSFTLADFVDTLFVLLSEAEGRTLRIMELEDMTYSAGQALTLHTSIYLKIWSQLIENPQRWMTYTSPELVTAFMNAIGVDHHVAFVYATEKANEILHGRTVYCPFSPDQVIPLLYPLTPHIHHVLPSLRAAVGEEMFKRLGVYFGHPSRYQEDQVAPDVIVYFDHKVADAVSTMGMPLLTGRMALSAANLSGKDWLAEELAPWVREWVQHNGSEACGTRPVPLLPACRYRKETNIPEVYPGERCPPPYYKSVNEATGEFRSMAEYTSRFPALKMEGGRRGRSKGTRRAKGTLRAKGTRQVKKAKRTKKGNRHH